MIVVTGSSGFIGTWLVDALHDGGSDVLGIDRLPPASLGCRHLTAELSAPSDEVIDALTRADAVVHLAGKPGVRERSHDVDRQRRRDNVAATRVVASATPLSTPLVVASSSSVYGGAAGGRPSRETDVLRPGGGYAISKLRSERWCRHRLDAGGHVTVVRPFTVVGPGQRADMAMSTWIDDASAGRPLEVFGSLQRRRDFTDVRFVTEVLIRLLDHRPTLVNVGSGTSRTLAELIGAVVDVVGETAVRLVPVPVVEPDETLADTHRLASIVGEIPVTDLRAVVADHVALRRRLIA